MTLAEAIRVHIERTLAECGGNVSEAARVLGIHRSSLQRRLWKWNNSEHIPKRYRPP